MEIGAVNFEDLFDFSPEPASAAAAAAAAAPNRSSRPTAIPSSTQQQQQQQQGSNLNYSQSVPSNWGSAGFASSAQQVSVFSYRFHVTHDWCSGKGVTKYSQFSILQMA